MRVVNQGNWADEKLNKKTLEALLTAVLTDDTVALEEVSSKISAKKSKNK